MRRQPGVEVVDAADDVAAARSAVLSRSGRNSAKLAYDYEIGRPLATKDSSQFAEDLLERTG
jgi:hypothetical protein